MAIARQRITLPPACWRSAVGSLVRGDLLEGEKIAELERRFAQFIGVPQAVAVPSARAGLRFLFGSLDPQPGDEVVCSAFGYPIVPFLVRAMGFQLRFVDCELTTLGLDPEALEGVISDRTRAVVATHLYGVPCRIDEIAQICASRRVHLIEDCAHCYGASVDGRKAGAFGSGAYFSFETSKMINTMGGGIVTLTDEELATKVRRQAAEQPAKDLKWLASRLLRTSFEATVTHPWLFNLGVYQALRFAPRRGGESDRFASGYHGDEVSMSGRLGRFTNFQAGLALRQIERLDPASRRRNQNAERLMNQLQDRVRFQRPAREGVTANYMLVTALFENMSEICDGLLRLGVDSKHHYMRDCSGMFEQQQEFPNAALAERQVLHLPAYPELDTARIDRVAAATRQVLSEQSGS